MNVSITVDSCSLKWLGNEQLRLILRDNENEGINKNSKYSDLQHPDLCFGDPPIVNQHIRIPVASIFSNSITNSELSADKLAWFFSFLCTIEQKLLVLLKLKSRNVKTPFTF